MSWLSLSAFRRRRASRRPQTFRPEYQSGPERLEDRLVPAVLPAGFTETVVAAGLHAPSTMAVAPDGRIFVGEQDGTIRVIDHGQLQAAPFAVLSTLSTVERGLVGMTVGPHFATDHDLYVYYSTAASPHVRISRFDATGDTAGPGGEHVLVDLPRINPKSFFSHLGGAMAFGSDGKLYVGTGEIGTSSNAQSLNTPYGKVLRFNADGSIPQDNPYFRQTRGINRAIWARGLRNPFTGSLDPATGAFLINDVGLDKWEKIDLVSPRANYGWPVTELVTARTAQRFTAPVFSYAHGDSPIEGEAITGGAFYRPPVDQFPAQYVGAFFFQDLEGDWIHVLNPATRTITGFATGLEDLSVALAVDSAGNLYSLARGTGPNTGTLYRISYAPAT